VWVEARKKVQRYWSNLVWARLSSFKRDSLGVSGLGEFRRALVSIGAFQLFLFSFVYSPFVQSSPFFPRILKLTQIWESFLFKLKSQNM